MFSGCFPGGPGARRRGGQAEGGGGHPQGQGPAIRPSFLGGSQDGLSQGPKRGPQHWRLVRLATSL